MSLEKTVASNTATIERLIVVVTALAAALENAPGVAPAIVSVNPPTVTAGDDIKAATKEKAPAKKAETKTKAPAAPKVKKPDPKILKEQTLAIITEVMKQKGKPALADVLSRFGCQRWGDVSADQYPELIKVAQMSLAGNDALVESMGAPAEEPAQKPRPTLTLEDVRLALTQVSNQTKLGREIARGILKSVGLERLQELTEDKFVAVHAAALKSLADNEGGK